MEFKPGDIVQLKSGGPTMTVQEIDDGGVFCVWFDKNKQQSSYFAPILLKEHRNTIGLD